jgi:GalNAc-alpha-(1->4)-GalNAc-alpha-(1->3)-diNAcBac-PP-undecaprenol alpha-1,4-N-acetyl-D-galactosaminyltransferase
MYKKKFCLVIPYLQAGGMERVMSELAGYFCQKDDLEVHIVIYGKDIEVFYTIPDSLIVHTPKSKFNDSVRFLSSIGRLIYLRNKVKEIDPDSVLSFGEYWNSFVLLSLYGLHYPVYVSDRCQPGKDLGKLHTVLRKWLYPRAKGIIAQTSKAKDIYMNQFRHNNIRIIGNPIHIINDFADKPVKENIVLTVGRLIKTKNHDKLIELFDRINMPGWKLIIVGEDAQKQNQKIRLQTLIKKLNAEHKVILAGNQSDVGLFYLKSKIFIFTSDSEGFPNVIGEAQAFGLPVIAFDCIAGPSDLIKNGENGILVPLYDYVALEENLSRLMNNPELRESLASNSSKTIKSFSIDKIGEEFYSFMSADL